MIGKIITGKSFRGCMNYLHEGRLQENEELQKQEMEKKQAQVIAYNQCFGTKKELIRQFIEVSKLNPKVSKPVFHATISFAYADANKLNYQDKADIAAGLAKDFGFSDNQYVVISHGDTQHEHLHVVANRIDYNGRTASDSNSYKRMADFCRKMEIEHKLTQVLSPNKFLAPELRVAQSQRVDNRKEALKQHLSSAMQHCRSVKEVKQYMEGKGYKVELGRGIAFIDQQMVRFKGSQAGYSLVDIEKKLKQEMLLQQKQTLASELKQERTINQSRGI
ncbi:MAG TPA: relaxase/mobilization nuclease domain-containing protein [Hanamia sp.]